MHFNHQLFTVCLRVQGLIRSVRRYLDGPNKRPIAVHGFG
jgi:hypothetical protein